MSAAPLFRRILAYGGILAAAIAVVGSVAGFFVAGGTGVASALIGAAMALVFLGITAASILVALRVANGQMLSGAFFGIVMGAWLIKFVIFIVLLLLLKGQPWVQTGVLFLTLVVAIIGTLAVDLIVIARSRLGYVSDVNLPGDQSAADDEASSRPDQGK
jgi:hypothetical protein